MRWWLIAVVALGACGESGDDDDDTDGGDDAGAHDGGDDGDAGNDGRPCELVTGVRVEGTAMPGAEVTLIAESPAGAPELEARWTVPSGTLSSATGAEVQWTIADGIALHTAETLEVRVTASAEGCAEDEAVVDVVVDWTDGMRTVVLFNPSVARSEEVAERYAGFRGVPDDHLCGVAAADMVTVLGRDFPEYLDAVMACVEAAGPQVHVVVPVWGVPYKVTERIRDLSSRELTTTSLDALLFFGADAVDLEGPGIENPAYQYGDSQETDYDPWIAWGTLRETIGWDYLLVARIDGADADAALALVDRAEDAANRAREGTLAGIVYVDGNRGLPHPATDTFGSYEGGEWNIVGVENVFEALGAYEVVANYDEAEFGTEPAPLACPDALYYAGWYSFGHYNDAFTWAPGAVGGHLDSCSACDIRGERDWSAMALRRGITATFGAVNEPYVAGMPEYDQFFEYLTHGATYAEAAYESTIMGAWMMVWIGDPWYRPYPSD